MNKNLEPWQESFVLYMYQTQQRFYTSFEQYKSVIPDTFFFSIYATMYQAAYTTGYINGYSDACDCKRSEI